METLSIKEFRKRNGCDSCLYSQNMKRFFMTSVCPLVIEKENVQNLDKAADPTAKMLSSLLRICAKDQKVSALERLGYCLGRWIYILDAAADLKDDIKHNKYNPLKNEAKLKVDIDKFLVERLEGTLTFCATEAAAAFELVEIKRFKNILGNIIYLGLEQSMNQVIKKENESNERPL